METYYRNNLNGTYLVLEGECGKEDFQTEMLQRNEIPGLLKTSVRYMDTKICYQYDISGKTSLKMMYEKEKLGHEAIKSLVNEILSAMKGISQFMLDGNKILLEPEYIFLENGRFWFCYYPLSETESKGTFHTLTEFFVREVDYQDREGVHLAYTLHKATMEENYSVEKIMEEALKEKEPTVVRYDERIEEEAERNIAIAEKREFWEPVRKLLDRKKKEKWGYWDEVSMEEDDL